MQHRSLVYRTGNYRAGSAVLTLGLLVLPGCLVPLPLEQQNSVDGGQLLMVTDGRPPFGTQPVLKLTDASTYKINVISDSPSLAARLYRKVDGTCCDLDLSKGDSTRFLLQAQVTRPAPDKNNYTVDFNNPVVLCDQTPAGSTIFIVPVLASGGFIPDPNSTQPDGIGVVDRSHYWTVHCP